MPPSSNAISIATREGGAAGPREALYESASTRVVRLTDAAAAQRVVWKEYLGARGAQRLRHEKNLLKRLAGIEGVVQLAMGVRGAHALAMQDVGGVTLAQLLQAGPCDTGTLLSLACQLARALAEIHRAGFIHRDINPANILVSRARQAVLIDFDLAVPLAQQAAGERAGQIVGTLSYIAPEQTGRTGHPVDQRADLYALGATLYQMAVGRPPFEQADALQLMHDHLVREPLAPCEADAGVPWGLSNIILRLLAKAPEQRYQGAEGLLHDLQRLRDELQHGRDAVFELGERDFGARLAPPAVLVGRDAEIAMLRDAFAQAMHTPRRTVLIDGPAGVGKSVLINELRPLVAEAGGWFVYGKFDQFHQGNSTLGALTQALRTLGRLLLTQPGDEVASQRRRILHSLGNHAGLITRASPEFALLLGEHADVPEVDPRQGELQLQQAMLDLLLAVATPECPLVVVLDDLQWSSTLSLRLFERIMVAGPLGGLLLVGSFRSDEASPDDVFASMLAKWQRLAVPPRRITLANLTVADLGELTAQMLRLPPGPSRRMAESLRVLTGGNPFDTVEMINALRGDGVLRLGETGWQWDDEKVRRFIGRGNVVDLLVARIGRLPATSRELMEYMSCLGGAVTFPLLRAAVGLQAVELHARLRAPLEDGLVLADAGSGQEAVRFRHDRVQQAMLGALDDAHRARLQLDMARRLAREPGFESEAAQQYLACAARLVDPREKRHAAHLFHALAQVLASTATHALADRFLLEADVLLASIDEPGDELLRAAVDLARHRTLYSLGRMEEADPIYDRIGARAPHPLDLVQPTCLQMRSLDMRGRPRESLALSVQLLEQLGFPVAPGFIVPDKEQRLAAISEWLRHECGLDHSKRAPTRDPRLLGMYKLLPRMYGSAFHCQDRNAVVWVELQAQAMWAEHGPSEDLMGCLCHLGPILISERGDYRTAYELARRVIAVGTALGFEVRTEASRFAFAWQACPWFEPLENALDHATRAFEVFQVKGDDAAFSCYFNIPRYVFLLEIAPTIDICEAEIEAGLVLCRRTGNGHAAALHMCDRQLTRALRGQTQAPGSFDDHEFREASFMAGVGHLPHLQVAMAHCRAFLGLILGDLSEAVRHDLARPVANSFDDESCRYRAMHRNLVRALASAWALQKGDPSSPASAPLITELESSRLWLERRAADQPYNFCISCGWSRRNRPGRLATSGRRPGPSMPPCSRPRAVSGHGIGPSLPNVRACVTWRRG